MSWRNSLIETSSPTSPTSPGSASSGCFGYAVAFIVGCFLTTLLYGYVFSLAHPPADSPALRLPDHFVLFDNTSPNGRGSLFVLDDRKLTRAGFRQPHDDLPLHELWYDDGGFSNVLLTSKLSATDGWHHFQVLDWDKKTVAYVHIEDAGKRLVNITDASGKILAQGKQDAMTRQFDFHLPQGLELAIVVFDVKANQWQVTIENPSRVPSPVYALIAAYETVIGKTAGKAG